MTVKDIGNVVNGLIELYEGQMKSNSGNSSCQDMARGAYEAMKALKTMLKDECIPEVKYDAIKTSKWKTPNLTDADKREALAQNARDLEKRKQEIGLGLLKISFKESCNRGRTL